MVTLTCCIIAYQRDRKGLPIGDIQYGMAFGCIPDGVLALIVGTFILAVM